jgi:hypothetical protein
MLAARGAGAEHFLFAMAVLSGDAVGQVHPVNDRPSIPISVK